MKRCMTAGIAAAALLALAPGEVASAAPTPLASDRVAGAEFTDPKGDSGTAPDIEAVEVGNDVMTGDVVLWVKVANRKTLDADDEFLFFLDTDLNPATGGAAGFDYVIYVDGDGTRILAQYTDELRQVPARTLRSSFSGTQWLGVRIHASELGGTRGFNFFVVSSRGEDDDDAPAAGLWSYSLVTGPPKLTVDRFALSPKPVRSGRPLTVTMAVWREDVMDSLAAGQVTCNLKLKGVTLRVAARGFGTAGATCRFNIPRAARGSAYTLTMTVAFGGSKVTRTTSGKVA
jgi:hypothetical protein